MFKRCQCRDQAGKRVKNCRKAHGSYTFVMDAGYDPDTGKRRQITRSGYRTRDAAEQALTAELARLNAGTWTDDHGTTLGMWLDQWLADLAAADRAVNTITNYTTHVRDAWKPQLGHILLRELRRAHIDRVLRDLAQPLDADRAAGNIGRRITRRSPATIESYRKTIRAALAAALRHELIAVNPALGRFDAIPRPTADTDDEPVMWEMEQTASFLEHVMSDRLSALYEVAAYAGLRRAELCGLRWSDIDEAGLTVRLTCISVTRKQVSPEQARCPICGAVHIGRLLKAPKSRAGRRWVPLAAPALAALARHRQAQQNEREFFGADYSDHDLVFCRPDGTPLRPDRATAEFEQHVATCGLPIIRLHDTRHGACSLMLAGGVPIEVVQMILGHASPDITRRVYKHLMRGEAAQQVEKASELLTRHRPRRNTM